MNGLAALRDLSVPVRIVVLDNGGGGIFEFLPQAEQLGRDEFEALLGTPLALELARVAALYELPHLRIADLDELVPASSRGTSGPCRNPRMPGTPSRWFVGATPWCQWTSLIAWRRIATLSLCTPLFSTTCSATVARISTRSGL